MRAMETTHTVRGPSAFKKNSFLQETRGMLVWCAPVLAAGNHNGEVRQYLPLVPAQARQVPGMQGTVWSGRRLTCSGGTGTGRTAAGR